MSPLTLSLRDAAIIGYATSKQTQFTAESRCRIADNYVRDDAI